MRDDYEAAKHAMLFGSAARRTAWPPNKHVVMVFVGVGSERIGMPVVVLDGHIEDVSGVIQRFRPTVADFGAGDWEIADFKTMQEPRPLSN